MRSKLSFTVTKKVLAIACRSCVLVLLASATLFPHISVPVYAQQSSNERRQDYARMGLIEVTNPPPGIPAAVGDGETDDTAALQAIINYAFHGNTTHYIAEFNQVDPDENEGRFAVILPGDDNDPNTPFKGVYKVSDTLWMFQNTVRDKRKGERANILIGSTATGVKPIIELAANSPKFANGAQANNPIGQSRSVRPVIMISSNAGTTDQGGCGSVCNYLKTGDNFEQKIKNIKIVIKPGNPRAVGLNFAGAQHSAIEDIVIDAGQGFAGIDGLPGVSSVATNIEIIGGRYGFYGADDDSNAYAMGQHKVLAISNIKFINQSDYAVYSPQSLGVLTLVGFEIRKNTAPAILTSQSNPSNNTVSTVTNQTTHRSELALVDGIIEFDQDSNTPAIDNTLVKGTSLTNVYFKKAAKLIQSGTGTSAITLQRPTNSNVDQYTRVSEYAIQNDDFDTRTGIVVDGQILDQPDILGNITTGLNPRQDSFLTSHTWHHANLSFDDLFQKSKQSGTQVCNAKPTALGNGVADDYPALQALINRADCRTIILPRGRYLISNTLQLKAYTRLIGLNTSMTTIAPHSSFQVQNGVLKPMIQTVDDAAATNTVEDLIIEIATETPQTDWLIGLDWRSGKWSMVKNVYTRPKNSPTGAAKNPKPQDRISGNGGGKWFAYDGVATGGNPTVVSGQNRKLLVENTTQPLNFYNLSSEDGQASRADAIAGYQSEFRNARNIAVYGSKNENCNPYGIVNSDNIFFFGVGKMNMSFIVKDSNNVLLKTFSPQHADCSMRPLGNNPAFESEMAVIQRDGNSITIQKNGKTPLAYYKKGQPNRGLTLISTENPPPEPSVSPTPSPTPTLLPSPSATPIPGDIAPVSQPDGVVNIQDYNLLLEKFGQTGTPGFHPADIVRNGAVDIWDYNALLQNFSP